MKKLILLTIGMLAAAVASVHAQNAILDATYEDWTNYAGVITNGGDDGWFGYQPDAVSTFSYGGITVNGLANPTDPGTNSVTGALEMPPVKSGWGPMMGGGDGALPVLQAFDGPLATSGALVAQNGTVIIYYTQPDDNGGGSYFQIGLYLNYAGGWGGSFPSTTVDLGPVTTPSGTEEMMEAVIPYSIAACNLYYWEWGFFQNTDYTGTKPWYIASVQTLPFPTTITYNPTNTLFATSNDFAQWSGQQGATVQADDQWTESNTVTDGAGNTNAAGATGVAGSLLITWTATDTSFGAIAAGPNEAGNAAFLQAIDPGCNPSTQAGVPAYGNVFIDYSEPDTTGGGSYFELGISFSYAGNGYNYYNALDFQSSVTDLGYQDDNGDEVYRATCPYVISGGSLNGFTPYVIVNSDYQPANPFHVNAISVSSSGAPIITNVSLSGSSLVLNCTNGFASDSYTLYSTTDITKPMSQWSVVGTPGTPFTGPTFNITNTVNPASPQVFYAIKASAP